MSNIVKSYKGFDKDLKCRNFQYEVGKTYEHQGSVEACSSGFHACQNPLDVFRYYGVATSRFAEVEQEGDISKEGSDSKVASRKITIKAEINIAGLAKAAVQYISETCGPAKKGVSATSGDYAHSATSGYSAHSATSGNSAHSATSGYYAHSATSGNYANSATSGYYAHSATSGNYANSATSGNYANSATSGYYANSATSGDYANSATSGYYANSATSGNYAHSATSGNYANSATSGYYANSATSGDSAVAANAGDGAAKASAGGAIFIVERDRDRNLLAVFASKVGENGIEPNTWYALKGGKPVVVEVEE